MEWTDDIDACMDRIRWVCAYSGLIPLRGWMLSSTLCYSLYYLDADERREKPRLLASATWGMLLHCGKYLDQNVQ